MIRKLSYTVAAFVLCAACFFGGMMAINDLPDWLSGFDPIEAARNFVAGLQDAQTGHVIWSHNFEEGLSVFDVEALTTGTAVKYADKAYSGDSSLRMLTAAAINDYVTMEKFISLPTRSKFGIEFYLLGEWPAGNGAQHIQVKIYHKLTAGAGTYLRGTFQIARDAAGVETFYVWTGGAWVSPAISTPPIFRETGGAPTDSIWHRIKLVGDYADAAPHYDCLEIDNERFDLSAYVIDETATANVMPWFYLSIAAYTEENSINGVYIDRLTVTDQEP